MDDRRYFHISYIAQAGGLLVVLIPFVLWNNLLEWDFPGHYAAIWHLRTHLLPWPTGWNPYFYCGYPQGLFYPPLAHYLAALLSLVVGIGPAMKTFIALSLLLLPACFYAFARRWGLDHLQSSVCSLWMTALLFLSGEVFGAWTLGSDLRSILNVGLFANAFSLPLLFGFLASWGKGDSLHWKLPALLLGLLLGLHPISSLIAGLFILTATVEKLFRRHERPAVWTPPLLSVGIALLIGSWWLLPFVKYRSLMNPSFTPAQWPPVIQLIVLNGVICAIVSFSKPLVRPLALTYLILANFILVGTMWRIDLQFTRLTTYLLFFLPVFLVAWIRSKPALLATALLAVLVGVVGYRRSGIHPLGVPDFPLPGFGPVSGRILSVAPYSHLPGPHVNHELIPLRTGNEAILGLFIESSLNGRILADLMRTLDPDAHVWGTPTESLTPQALGKEYPQYLRERLRLFNISHIYTDLRLEEMLDPSLAEAKKYLNSYPIPKLDHPAQADNLKRRYHTHANLLDFYLYPVGAGALAEPLPYMPTAITSDWTLTNLKWFLEMRRIPVFTNSATPAWARPARPGERVEILSQSPNKDRFVLNVAAEQDIPILVRVGYFPGWTLKVDGKPAPVYRASPSLVLIFAHGQAVLEYRRSWVEYAGLALSLVGLGLLLFLPRSPGREISSPVAAPEAGHNADQQEE